MENGTLSGVLKHDFQHPKHLNSKQRLEISKGIAEGICYIHRLNTEPSKMLIHRDIKTSNILLDHDFTPKVTLILVYRKIIEIIISYLVLDN